MKLTFKNLKQQIFTIDIDDSKTIGECKKKLAEEHAKELFGSGEINTSDIKLIHSGKILADDNTIEGYKIDEKGFIVCMVNKQKPPAPSPSTVTSKPANVPSGTANKASNLASAAWNSASEALAPPSRPANDLRSVAPGTMADTSDENNLLTGAKSEEAINDLTSMGFGIEEVKKAMRAAFNNPDRAVEYLLTGIPENLGPRTDAPPADAAATSPTSVEQQPESTNDRTNLFEAAAAAAAQRQPVNQDAGSVGTTGAGIGAPSSIDNEQLLRILQDPEGLPRLLSQHPQLLQQLRENPEMLSNLIGSLGGGDQPVAGGTDQQAISVTEDERNAIERLADLGFDRNQAIQAYFACDKNEELAANFLFDHPGDDEDQSQNQ